MFGWQGRGVMSDRNTKHVALVALVLLPASSSWASGRPVRYRPPGSRSQTAPA